MNFFQAIILGLVQGLCEFLPISSSGHLVLLQQVFGISEGSVFFDIMLHVGTLAAVFVAFRHTIKKMLLHPFSKYPLYIVLATIPTVIIAILLGDFFEAAFSGKLLGFAFLITSFILLVSGRVPQQKKTLHDIRPLDALMMGTMQGVAIAPGISRSGATITGGLCAGLERGFAAEFSFLMSIPAILGSLVLQILKVAKGELVLGSIHWGYVIIGMVCAALSGYFSVQVMLRAIKKSKLEYFGIYTAILGVLILIDQNISHFFF